VAGERIKVKGEKEKAAGKISRGLFRSSNVMKEYFLLP